MMAFEMIPYHFEDKTSKYKLQSLVNSLERDLEDTEIALAELDTLFQPFNQELAAEVAALSARLEDLKTILETTVNSKHESLVSDSEEKVPAEFKENLDKEVSASENILRKCKKLYKKISAKCHPDKDVDGKYTEFFHQAKSALLDLNYVMLQAIQDSLEISGKSKLSNGEEIALLEMQKQELQIKLRELRNSEEYELLLLTHKRGLEFAISIRSRSLHITKQELQDEIFKIEEQL